MPQGTIKTSSPKPAVESVGHWSRRRFLNSAVAGLGSVALAGKALAGTAPSDYGQALAPRPGRRILGANDRILLGLIGSGGIGRRHVRQMLENNKVNNCEFIAICDIYEPNRNEGIKMAGGKAQGFNEHEKLLDLKDLDGVVIATPDHWHERILIDSVLAGKDAYCEKPLSWSIDQGANMVRQVRRAKRIVQVGMQRRSTPSVFESKKIIDSGFLGEVSLVRAWWYWNIPDLPATVTLEGDLDWERFQAPLPADKRYALNALKWKFWRYFWEYSGGNLTDQGTHLIDVIQWMLNDSKPPQAAQEHGAVYQIKGYETPDTFCALFEYPKFMATFTLTYTNSWHDSWGIVFHGRKGTLELDDNGARFYEEPWPHKWTDDKPKLAHEVKGPLRMDLHESNFLDCMRTRQEPNCPIEIGHQAVSALHLANAAHHARRRAVLDADGQTIKIA